MIACNANHTNERITINMLHVPPHFLLVLVVVLANTAHAVTGDRVDYLGSEACRDCHDQPYEAWLGSHHQQAMQHASEYSVLGDFDKVEFVYNGIVSRFYTHDGKFVVTTDNADGEPEDFTVRYTFGVYPLQQYLVEQPGGRLQALGIAWDSRARADGGQRWFHLYPDDAVDHRSTLHWTRRNHNWNQMCAGCHSTDLQRNYTLETDSYQTTWSEISVGCESCHGPGAGHVARVKSDTYKGGDSGFGLELRAPVAAFERDGNEPTRRPIAIGKSDQVDRCASCHARRGELTDDAFHQRQFLDGFLPALVNAVQYHPDGQVDGENYVYGSFLQSRMSRQGVVCSNCHEPHSLELRAVGNALCAQCHDPATFDDRQHHRHAAESPGSFCVDCHMPAQNFMVVDARRDHGFRVPDPWIARDTGSPDTCLACHTDRDQGWSIAQFERWGIAGREAPAAAAFYRADLRLDNRHALLEIASSDASAITRASALERIVYPLQGRELDATIALLADPDPLVRIGAVRALRALPLEQRRSSVQPALDDPVRAVRVEAGELLSALGGDPDLSATERRALGDYLAYLRTNLDRAWARVNYANNLLESGQPGEAESWYRKASRAEPGYIPAYVNLADLYRGQGREGEAEKTLEAGLQRIPESADLHYATGLLYVRLKRPEKALEHLQRASALNVENSRYPFTYAVALSSYGKKSSAFHVLEAAARVYPQDLDIGMMLISFYVERRDAVKALTRARQLQRYHPDDETLKGVITQLRQALSAQ